MAIVVYLYLSISFRVEGEMKNDYNARECVAVLKVCFFAFFFVECAHLGANAILTVVRNHKIHKC